MTFPDSDYVNRIRTFKIYSQSTLDQEKIKKTEETSSPKWHENSMSNVFLTIHSPIARKLLGLEPIEMFKNIESLTNDNLIEKLDCLFKTDFNMSLKIIDAEQLEVSEDLRNIQKYFSDTLSLHPEHNNKLNEFITQVGKLKLHEEGSAYSINSAIGKEIFGSQEITTENCNERFNIIDLVNMDLLLQGKNSFDLLNFSKEIFNLMALFGHIVNPHNTVLQTIKSKVDSIRINKATQN